MTARVTVDGSMRSVLLIDDDADGRAALAFVLQARGDRVLEAEDGLAGLALARQHRPDVIVLDLGLPGLDGWETTRRLRADPGTASACIVALTGHTTGEAWQRAKDAGVDVYLLKPCSPGELIAELDRLAAPGTRG
jgi:two-component system, sensor histidine kinase